MASVSSMSPCRPIFMFEFSLPSLDCKHSQFGYLFDSRSELQMSIPPYCSFPIPTRTISRSTTTTFTSAAANPQHLCPYGRGSTLISRSPLLALPSPSHRALSTGHSHLLTISRPHRLLRSHTTPRAGRIVAPSSPSSICSGHLPSLLPSLGPAPAFQCFNRTTIPIRDGRGV